MPSIRDVNLNQVFSFEVYPTNVIGNNFRNVRLEGIFNAKGAMAFGMDVEAMHAAIYPALPAGVPNNPFDYDYIRIQFPNGEYTMIGIPWIRQETIQISTAGQVVLVFENKTDVDIERMVNALSANGYRPDDVRKAV